VAAATCLRRLHVYHGEMRSPFVVLGITLVSAAVPMAGCGSGDGGGGSCSVGEACGGDIVGTWNFSKYCLNGMMSFEEFCPTATVDTSGIVPTGTAQFTASMTYMVNITLAGDFRVTLPSACLTQQGITITCDQLNQSYQMIIAQPDSPFTSASCTAGGGGCRCAFGFRSTASTESGTYTISGNTVTTTNAADGMADTLGYCATANSLELIDPMMTGGIRLVR
jgi:hypothetical protein